jgi:lipopolysaccharide export system protein LptC
MTAEAAARNLTYRRLERRNRVVGVLRWAVPALGLVTLVVLVGQIYLSSLGNRFGIDSITVGRDSITVDAPEYSGLLEDGSAYRVAADAAEARLDSTELIDLTAATLRVDKPDGTRFGAIADEATIDTTRQLVLIEGDAEVEQSTGTSGRFIDSVFDWQAQTLTVSGSVDIVYEDGATVEAEGLVYDARRQLWTFSRATVTLPDTPGSRGSTESE